MKPIDSNQVLVFGGAYSNLQALNALYEIAKKLQIAPHQVICTGDSLAYCGQPNETIQALKNWGVRAIQGNVEEQIINDLDDCGCNFVEGSVCDTLSSKWYSFLKSELDTESRKWIAGLPKTLNFEIFNKKVAVVHGGFGQISKYIFLSTEWSTKASEIERAEADIVLAGHCGLPFIEIKAGKVWANAGAIGMPANDGTTETWYMIISRNPSGLQFTTHRLVYDLNGAANSMREKQLPPEYIKSLTSGIWPSCEILPAIERKQQGQPLNPVSLTLPI